MNLSFSQTLSLIHVQAAMKLKSQANTLVLSYLWWVLEPLLYVALFYFVFKYILYRGGDDFLVFLVLGKIPFLWFSKSITSGASSLIENRGLIMQRVIPKYIFPLVNCLECFYKQSVAFLVLFVFVLLSGYGYNHAWLQLPLIILLNYILICGVAAFFSVIVTFASDFKMALQLFVVGMMFMSGIFWDVNMIQDPLLKETFLRFNPLASLFDGYRQILIHGNTVPWERVLTIGLWALVTSLIGFFALYRFNNILTRRLLA